MKKSKSPVCSPFTGSSFKTKVSGPFPGSFTGSSFKTNELEPGYKLNYTQLNKSKSVIRLFFTKKIKNLSYMNFCLFYVKKKIGLFFSLDRRSQKSK